MNQRSTSNAQRPTFNEDHRLPAALRLRRWKLEVGSWTFSLFLFLVASLHAEPQPNIVFIFADDLSFNDLSCYGRKDHATPHLDALAAQGLPNIMKAKKKPLDVLTPEALGVDVTPRLKTLKVVEPPKRKGGVIVADVAALIDKLKNEAKVI